MRRSRRLVAAASAGAALGALSACGVADDAGDDLSIANRSGEKIVVVVDGDELEVTADGGVVLLGHGCTTGDVVVRYRAGREVTLTGPVCPDRRVVVTDDGARLLPLPDADG